MAQLTLSGVVGADILAEDVRKFLANNQDEHIDVFINSVGGSVFEGLEVYNTLRASGRHVTTVLTGIAASMGSIIFLAGDERIAMTGTTFMVHKPSSIALGDADDFKKEAEVLDKIQDSLEEIYNERTSIENVNELVNDETWLRIDEMATNGVTNSTRQVNMTLGEEDMSKTDDLKAELEQVNARKAELEEANAKAEEAKQIAELEAQVANAKLETSQLEAQAAQDVSASEPTNQTEVSTTNPVAEPKADITDEVSNTAQNSHQEPQHTEVEDVIEVTNRAESVNNATDIPVWMQSDAKTKY